MLNPIEEEMLEVCEVLRENLSAGRPVHRMAHYEVMGRLRNMIIKLTNKKYGCGTGRHSGPCECVKK